MKIEKKKMQFYTEDFTQKKSSDENNTEMAVFRYSNIRKSILILTINSKLKKRKAHRQRKDFGYSRFLALREYIQ
jgi:hypothetical protein